MIISKLKISKLISFTKLGAKIKICASSTLNFCSCARMELDGGRAWPGRGGAGRARCGRSDRGTAWARSTTDCERGRSGKATRWRSSGGSAQRRGRESERERERELEEGKGWSLAFYRERGGEGEPGRNGRPSTPITRPLMTSVNGREWREREKGKRPWGGERARTPRSRARGGRGRGAARPGHTAREGEEREEGPRWGQPGSEGGEGDGGCGG